MKKGCVFLLLVCTLFVLTSCSVFHPADKNLFDYDGQKEKIGYETATESADSMTENNMARLDFSSSVYYHAYTWFSEGLSWVVIDGTTAIVNKTGEVVSEVDEDILHVTPFKNGLSLLVNHELTEKIIDTEGNILYTSLNNDEIQEHIVLQGDDTFLVIRHITDMTSDYYALGTIDKNGTLISSSRLDEYHKESNSIISFFDELSEYYYDEDLDYQPEFEYCGNGCFYHYRNSSGSALYYENPGTLLLSKFLIQGSIDENNYWVYKMDLGSGNVLSGIEFGILNTKDKSFSAINNPDMISSNYAYSAGKYWYTDRRVYDKSGNKICSISLYPELGFHLDEFSDNGYAPILFSGKDKKYYLTYINEQGKEMFTPVKCDSDYLVSYGEDCAAVCYDNCTVALYDVTGNKKEIQIEIFEPMPCEYIGEDYIMIGHKFFFF